MTPGSDSDCFACRPEAPRAREVPPLWSSPRHLCMHHKSTCFVSSGELVSDVLQRAKPAGYPLEGSALAFVYNPVYVKSESGVVVRGWAAFVGGGMGVFEDRFGAECYFDCYGMENHSAVSLLYVVRECAFGSHEEFSWPSFLEMLSVAASSESDTLRRLVSPRPKDQTGSTHLGPGDDILGVLSLLRCLWETAEHVIHGRAVTGRMWPASFEELRSWLRREPVGAAAAGAFFSRLHQLAGRRFPPV